MAKQTKPHAGAQPHASERKALEQESRRGRKRPTGGSQSGDSLPHGESPRPDTRRTQPPDESSSIQIDMDRIMPLSPGRRFSEQYVPYLWAALALFLTVSFILDVIGKTRTPQEHLMGVVGYWLCRILFGLFGWAAFLLPAVNVMMAVSWRRYCRERMVAFQFSMSALFMLLLSAFIHVCICTSDVSYLTADPAVLFRTGADFETGGVIGGWLGWLLYTGLRLPGSIVLMVIAMPLIVLSLIGITPVDAFGRIRAFLRRRSRERQALADTRREQAEQRRLEREREREEARERAESLRREADRQKRPEPPVRAADLPDEEPLAAPQAAPPEPAASEAAAGRADSPSAAVASGRQTAPDDEEPAGTAKDTRSAAEKRAVWVDPVTGEVLREGGMNGQKSPSSVKKSRTVTDDGKAVDDAPAEDSRPTATRMEVELDQPPERNDELPAPEDADRNDTAHGEKASTGEVPRRSPLEELPKRNTSRAKTKDDASPSGHNESERSGSGVAGRVIQAGGDTAIPITVLPSESAAITGTPDNPVDGLPDEEIVSAGNTLPNAPAYEFPPLSLLTRGSSKFEADEAQIQKNTQILQSTLESFRIRVKSVTCSCGPTVTRYEVRPDAGVRVRSISNLVDDIAMNLAKAGVRIEAPIPGKSAVGIEVPNDNPATVYLRNLLETPEFQNAKSRITSCLGCEVSGRPVIFDINKMPHLLVSGTTGSGKSVCINCIILSILYKAKPEEVKLILIDPKKVEFSMYRDIPHLYCPIVTDPKKAAGALYSAVAEMERRFELIEEVGVRNLAGYNEITAGDNEHPPMPQMIIIIDELADLMMTAPTDVESAICRLAQKGRAAGIHLILGTQRPSVDVITGLIKANVPSRIAFTVKSQVDSRTIIDVAGAEKLIGRGDMLYAPVGSTKPLRVQGAFVSDSEVESVVNYVKEHNEKPVYDESFMQTIDVEAARCGTGKKKGGDDQLTIGDLGGTGSDEDSKYWDAVDVAVSENKVSTSLLQRRLELGYGRAAKIIDRMQEMGFVSPADGNKPRKVLITQQDLAELRMNRK